MGEDLNNTSEIRAVKAGVFYTIVGFLTKAMGLITTPLFTRIMSPEDIGAYANLSSWASVLAPIVTFNLTVSLSLARFDHRTDLKRFASSILVFGSAITGICYAVVALNMSFFSDLFSMQPFVIHFLFISMLLSPAIDIYQSQNMFQFRYKQSTALSLTMLIVTTASALALTIGAENKFAARVYGSYIPSFVFYVLMYVYILKQGKGVKLKYFKYAVAISFPMIWHTLSIQVLSAGDRIVITRMLGTAANARYSVAYSCGHVAALLYNAMNNAWSPWSAAKMDSGETEQMKKASRPYILFFCFCTFPMMLLAPELLAIMGGKAYVEAKYVLPPVTISCIAQFIYSLYINAEFYLKKQTRIAVGTILASALNIGLNVIFVPRYGYVAAAYTTLFGYVCLFLFHYVSLRLLKKKHWYDNRFNFIVLAAAILTIPLINFLYAHDPVRIAVFVLFCVGTLIALVKKRDILIPLAKRFIHSR